MNNAKIWILITGIVVIVSGFLLYSLISSRETEKATFMVKIQELTTRAAELERVKAELETLRKQKADAEAKAYAEIAALEAQVSESKRSESLTKSRLEALIKEKETLSQYVESNSATIAKLNKKIEALEKERDQALQAAQQEPSGPSFTFVDPINESPDATAGGAVQTRPVPTMGAKLAEEEVVDLGRIIVHPSTHEAARVEHVNPLYGFVVLSAGTNDGLQKDSVINITRNNRLIAKAVIKKVREDAASAVTLPEWTREEIRVGDLVSINTPSPLPL